MTSAAASCVSSTSREGMRSSSASAAPGGIVRRDSGCWRPFAIVRTAEAWCLLSPIGAYLARGLTPRTYRHAWREASSELPSVLPQRGSCCRPAWHRQRMPNSRLSPRPLGSEFRVSLLGQSATVDFIEVCGGLGSGLVGSLMVTWPVLLMRRQPHTWDRRLSVGPPYDVAGFSCDALCLRPCTGGRETCSDGRALLRAALAASATHWIDAWVYLSRYSSPRSRGDYLGEAFCSYII